MEEVIICHSNGNLAIKGTKNSRGYFVGSYEEYHENGQLKCKGTMCSQWIGNRHKYKSGSSDTLSDEEFFIGHFAWYHENGNPELIGVNNLDGSLRGEYKWYHENGQLQCKGVVNAQGNSMGPYEEYDKEGNPVKLGYFDNKGIFINQMVEVPATNVSKESVPPALRP